MTLVFSEAVDTEAKPNGSSPSRFSLFSGASNLFSAQMIRRVARLIFLLIVARVLGPTLSGVYAFLLAVVETLAILSGAGFSDYLAREAAKSPSAALPLAFRTTQLRYIYVVVLTGITLLGLHAFGYSVLNAALFSLTLFPRSVLEASQGLLRAAHHLRPLVWQEFLQGITLLIVGIPLLRMGGGLRAVIWAELLSSLVGAIVAVRPALKSFPWGDYVFPAWRMLIRATIAFNFYLLLVNLYDRVDIILLSRLAGDYAVGIYALPYRAFSTLQVLPYAIMAALLPTLAKSNWDQKNRRQCARLMTLLYGMALVLILGTMILGRPAVLFALGERYRNSGSVLDILIWGTIPMFLNYGLNTFLLAKSQERLFLLTASVCVAVNIGANVLLIPRYSFMAAAAVTILTELVMLVQNVVLVFRTFGYLILPEKPLRMTAGFLATLAFGLICTHYLPAIVVASFTLPLFGLYLYLCGCFPGAELWIRRALPAG